MTTSRTQDEQAQADYDLYLEFRRLADKWEEETRGYAFRSRAVQHVEHQQIVDLGEQVIPWMLEDFAAGKGDWFYALRLLTGADPIKEEERGYVPRMRAAWLEWGRQHGWFD